MTSFCRHRYNLSKILFACKNRWSLPPREAGIFLVEQNYGSLDNR